VEGKVGNEVQEGIQDRAEAGFRVGRRQLLDVKAFHNAAKGPYG